MLKKRQQLFLTIPAPPERSRADDVDRPGRRLPPVLERRVRLQRPAKGPIAKVVPAGTIRNTSVDQESNLGHVVGQSDVRNHPDAEDLSDAAAAASEQRISGFLRQQTLDILRLRLHRGHRDQVGSVPERKELHGNVPAEAASQEPELHRDQLVQEAGLLFGSTVPGPQVVHPTSATRIPVRKQQPE